MTELEVALEAAEAAARILTERAQEVAARAQGGDFVEHKGAIDLVTEVDRQCEEVVRRVLAAHTPDVPVLGEEGGGAEHAPTRWVVDPLDGTTNYVHGFPYYAVSVGLEVDGRREVGVVHAPAAARGRQVFAGRRGHGATVDGQPLRVTSRTSLDRALLATGFAYDRRERPDFYLARFRAFMLRAQGLRRAGAAALDLAHVAAGWLDGFWEYGLGPWDACAGALLVEQAGGLVTDVGGGPLDRNRPEPVAAPAALHAQMLAVLHEVAVG